MVNVNQIFERGRIVKGKVSGIKKYGIFVSFDNGYNGMIHISEISGSFVRDINLYAKEGEIIPCKIIELDAEQKKVKLTLKNLDYLMRRERHFNSNFDVLSKKLPDWIKEKMDEIQK